MTNRGWGSLGGKPYALQRLVYTGVVPMEIHGVSLTATGFDLTFTKPLDEASVRRAGAMGVVSHTYNYWSTYGSPEEDRKPEKVGDLTLSADRRQVHVPVANLRIGRVYEFHLQEVKSSEGEAVLHPEAYYTLNQLRNSGQ